MTTEMDNSHMPKMVGTIDPPPTDKPVIDRVSPETEQFIIGVIIIVLSLLALVFMGRALLA